MDKLNTYHDMRIEGFDIEGASPVYQRLKDYKFPQNLSNKRVLDVGAWDGFFSFESERRGAKEVVAIDTIAWENGGYERFLKFRDALGSSVKPFKLSVCDLDAKVHGQFDVILLLQILYHLENPMLALRKCRECCKEFMLLETNVQGEGEILVARENVGLLVHWPSRKWLEHALKLASFSFEVVHEYPEEDFGYNGKSQRIVLHCRTV